MHAWLLALILTAQTIILMVTYIKVTEYGTCLVDHTIDGTAFIEGVYNHLHNTHFFGANSYHLNVT